MTEGSTLLVSPCKLPLKDHIAMKRRCPDGGVMSCLGEGLSSSIASPCRKKLRRCLNSDYRPSTIRWKDDLENHCGDTPQSSRERNEADREESTSSSLSEIKQWYSKEEYKQMLVDQSLTVNIMRSLRSLAGEIVALDYCDETNSDNSRFDDLIEQNLIDPEEYCERGLESYLSDERRNEVNAARKLHRALVIGECIRQEMLGLSDTEKVRNVSLPRTKKSLMRAQKLALFDQRVARDITKNKKNVEVNHDAREQQPGTYRNNLTHEKKVTPLDVVWSQSDQQYQKMTDRPSTPTLGRKKPENGMDAALCDLLRRNTPKNMHRVESIAATKDNHDILTRQQLLHSMFSKQEQNRCAKPQFQFQRDKQFPFAIPNDLFKISEAKPIDLNSILDSVLTTVQIQEEQRLIHQLQEQQLQNQRNFQHQAQRLLLQQQQHNNACQLAVAAILQQCQPNF